eukprot:6213521-Alexandrium_andersonii.AAC.1
MESRGEPRRAAESRGELQGAKLYCNQGPRSINSAFGGAPEFPKHPLQKRLGRAKQTNQATDETQRPADLRAPCP